MQKEGKGFYPADRARFPLQLNCRRSGMPIGQIGVRILLLLLRPSKEPE